MTPPKRFGISPPATGRCSEGLDAFRFFFKELYNIGEKLTLLILSAHLLCVCVCVLIKLHITAQSGPVLIRKPLIGRDIRDLFLKENQNAPRPSEHLPVRGKKCQNV